MDFFNIERALYKTGKVPYETLCHQCVYREDVGRGPDFAAVRLDEAVNTLQMTYGAPAVLALITCVGLLSGVVGDGVWDAVSWLGLSIPVAVLGWFLFRPRSAAANKGARRD